MMNNRKRRMILALALIFVLSVSVKANASGEEASAVQESVSLAFIVDASGSMGFLADVPGMIRVPEEYPRVADDSLALELGFMAELARRSADAFGTSDADTLDLTLRGARDFLTEHLLLWVPKLLERLDKTEGRFYPRLAYILDSFLKKDLERKC